MEYHTERPQKVNVCCGIVDGRIKGFYFFTENLTGARYLAFLRDDLTPELIDFTWLARHNAHAPQSEL